VASTRLSVEEARPVLIPLKLETPGAVRGIRRSSVDDLMANQLRQMLLQDAGPKPLKEEHDLELHELEDNNGDRTGMKTYRLEPYQPDQGPIPEADEGESSEEDDDGYRVRSTPPVLSLTPALIPLTCPSTLASFRPPLHKTMRRASLDDEAINQIRLQAAQAQEHARVQMGLPAGGNGKKKRRPLASSQLRRFSLSLNSLVSPEAPTTPAQLSNPASATASPIPSSVASQKTAEEEEEERTRQTATPPVEARTPRRRLSVAILARRGRSAESEERQASDTARSRSGSNHPPPQRRRSSVHSVRSGSGPPPTQRRRNSVEAIMRRTGIRSQSPVPVAVVSPPPSHKKKLFDELAKTITPITFGEKILEKKREEAATAARPES